MEISTKGDYFRLDTGTIFAIIRTHMTNGASFEQEEKQRTLFRKIGYWYVTNKALLRRILNGVVISVAGIFWAYALWGLFDYFILNWSKSNQALEELVASRVFTQEWISKNRPRGINIGTARVFTREDDKYDFLAEIENSSSLYWAEFDYKFVFSGGETAGGHSFILPSEETWAAELSFEREARPASPRLELINIAWHRVDPREISDYEAWRAERLNLLISDIEQVSEISLEEGTYAKTKFNVQNLSGYGFYSVGFYIIAYRGTTPIGVNYVALKNFRTGERRAVEVSWFDTLPQVSKIEVRPEVNIFDQDNYMPI